MFMDDKKREFAKTHFWSGLLHLVFGTAILVIGYICNKYWGVPFELVALVVLCLMSISWWIIILINFKSLNTQARLPLIGIGIFLTGGAIFFYRSMFFEKGYTIIHIIILFIISFLPTWIYKRIRN